eukprot:8547263-Heterocapsa_arctica.AAC.1
MVGTTPWGEGRRLGRQGYAPPVGATPFACSRFIRRACSGGLITGGVRWSRFIANGSCTFVGAGSVIVAAWHLAAMEVTP